jgi:fimbrial chaperone protein
MRYSLPVMIAPLDAIRTALRWSACAAADGHACVRLNNDGNRRVTFKTLSIAGTSWNVAVNQPGTVLAGAAAEWHVDLPAGQGGPALRINGETGRGEQVQATLPAP